MYCDNCDNKFIEGGRVTEEYAFCAKCIRESEKEFKKLTGIKTTNENISTKGLKQ